MLPTKAHVPHELGSMPQRTFGVFQQATAISSASAQSRGHPQHQPLSSPHAPAPPASLRRASLAYAAVISLTARRRTNSPILDSTNVEYPLVSILCSASSSAPPCRLHPIQRNRLYMQSQEPIWDLARPLVRRLSDCCFVQRDARLRHVPLSASVAKQVFDRFAIPLVARI